MPPALELRHVEGRHVEIATTAGSLLWRYVYAPETPANEAPRPYAHPVCSLGGDVLTNFRPHDHPWHHGLSLTLAAVEGVNFWGGPSHRAADGYRWRADHGRQRHRRWRRLDVAEMEADVDWENGDGAVLLRERRELASGLVANGWSLRWTSELENVSGRTLALDNYHSLGGLAGSHYTGLQFRGARDLLDAHGDPAIGASGEEGRSGETALHGEPARWLEWRCQHDGSLRRTAIRFENLDGPLPWFFRAKNPVVAFAFHREATHALAAGARLRFDHRLTFTSS